MGQVRQNRLTLLVHPVRTRLLLHGELLFQLMPTSAIHLPFYSI